VKLFTTGCGITPDLARELRDAGMFSVSVSLDTSDEARHDAGRGYPGAYRAALAAIDTFLATEGLHVGISAVLPRATMQRPDDVERFLAFAASLGVHETWLSEVKPTVAPLWDAALVLTDDERRAIVDLQDRWNARVRGEGRGMAANYLGHFEGAETFGCNAGRKMIYVDPFGDVSPCVFTPFSLGNVRETPLADLVAEMVARFPSRTGAS